MTLNDFPGNSYEKWVVSAQKALRGTPLESVTVQTSDGIELLPVWKRRTDALPRAFRSIAGPWSIMQKVDHGDPNAANAMALEDLENGANGLVLAFDGNPTARGFGLRHGKDALNVALSDVALEAISIRIEEDSSHTRACFDMVAAIDGSRDNLAGHDIDFGIDSIGAVVRGSLSADDWALPAKATLAHTAHWAERGFSGRLLIADSRPYQEAGASEVQELAFVLATGLAYMRALKTEGLSTDEARRRLSFLLVADCDQFLTIAKFRGLRRLWARGEEERGRR
jgi:methylmalonyl-CoA mutase